MATTAAAPATTAAVPALSSCDEVPGLRAGAVPGHWFGVRFLRTLNQLARQELGLGADANISEDALW